MFLTKVYKAKVCKTKEANIEANNLIGKDYDETVLPTFLFFVLIVIILIYISFNISC